MNYNEHKLQWALQQMEISLIKPIERQSVDMMALTMSILISHLMKDAKQAQLVNEWMMSLMSRKEGRPLCLSFLAVTERFAFVLYLSSASEEIYFSRTVQPTTCDRGEACAQPFCAGLMSVRAGRKKKNWPPSCEKHERHTKRWSFLGGFTFVISVTDSVQYILRAPRPDCYTKKLLPAKFNAGTASVWMPLR